MDFEITQDIANEIDKIPKINEPYIPGEVPDSKVHIIANLLLKIAALELENKKLETKNKELEQENKIIKNKNEELKIIKDKVDESNLTKCLKQFVKNITELLICPISLKPNKYPVILSTGISISEFAHNKLKIQQSNTIFFRCPITKKINISSSPCYTLKEIFNIFLNFLHNLEKIGIDDFSNIRKEFEEEDVPITSSYIYYIKNSQVISSNSSINQNTQLESSNSSINQNTENQQESSNNSTSLNLENQDSLLRYSPIERPQRILLQLPIVQRQLPIVQGQFPIFLGQFPMFSGQIQIYQVQLPIQQGQLSMQPRQL